MQLLREIRISFIAPRAFSQRPFSLLKMIRQLLCVFIAFHLFIHHSCHATTITLRNSSTDTFECQHFRTLFVLFCLLHSYFLFHFLFLNIHLFVSLLNNLFHRIKRMWLIYFIAVCHAKSCTRHFI